nr:MAG TPA: hypothetical protein [Caudoviricetes sp.]
MPSRRYFKAHRVETSSYNQRDRRPPFRFTGNAADLQKRL